MNVPDAGLYLYHPDREELELFAAYSTERPVEELIGVRFQRGEGLAGQIVQTRQPLVVEDYERWEHRSHVFEGISWHSAMGVPLVHNDRLIGALSVAHLEAGRGFSKQDVALLRAFADQAALTIEQIHLQGLQRKFLAIGTQLLTATDLEVILKSVVQALVDHSPFRVGAVSIYARPTSPDDPNPPEIQEFHMAGLPPEQEARLWQTVREGKIVPTGRIVRRGRRIGRAYFLTPREMPELVTAGVPIERDASLEARPEWGEYDNLYYLLTLDGQVRGRISLADPTHGRVPTPEELKPMEMFVNLTTLAVQRAHYETRLQALYRVSQQLNQATTLDELFERTLALIKDVFAYDYGAILLADEAQERLTLAAQTGLIGCPYRVGDYLAFGQGVTGWVAQHQEPVLVSDVSDDPRYLRGEISMGSELAVPIQLAGTLLGVFNLESQHKKAFGKDDRRLLETLAGQLAVAISNLQRQEELRELAMHDALTGVYNRHFFTELIAKERERSPRDPHPISLVMVDMDDFHEVNDRFGHAEGDRVLREVARLLRESVRSPDCVVRYGGDEFLIVMREISEEEVTQAMERLQRRMEQWDPGLIGLKLSMSFGVASWEPGGTESLDDVLERADAFMYHRRQARPGRRQERKRVLTSVKKRTSAP